MAEAATATDANLALQQAAARTWIAAQSMVRALAKTGSPLFTPEVQAFQVDWNVFRRLSGLVPTGPGDSCKPGVAIPELTEDGQYGPQTSTGLYLFVASRIRSVPPCRAVGVPTWFAQNQDLIDAWIPPDAVSDAVEILGPSAAVNTVLTAAKVEQSAGTISAQDAGGAETQTIQQTTAAQPAGTSAPAAPSLCDAWSGSARRQCKRVGFNKFVKARLLAGETVTLEPGGTPRSWTKREVDPTVALCNVFTKPSRRAECKAVGFEAYLYGRMLQGDAFEFRPKEATAQITPATPATPAETHVDVEEETRIAVARPSGLTPILAIGAGALALGGILWWFTRPTRRAA